MNGQEAIESAMAGGRALIPFVTAGYPKRDATPHILHALDEGGARVIELGLPFSDSLADGPTVQASYHQAIEAGMTAKLALEQLAGVSSDLRAPVVLMGSLNPILALGMGRFVKLAAKAGAAGVLVPDLPPEDAGELRGLLRDAGLAPIPLAGPNTPEARYPVIAQGASGFLYQISRVGTTGVRTGHLPDGLADRVTAARLTTQLPVALGFGISDRSQVLEAWKIADAAVVGSALLRRLAGETAKTKLARRARDFVAELADPAP